MLPSPFRTAFDSVSEPSPNITRVPFFFCSLISFLCFLSAATKLVLWRDLIYGPFILNCVYGPL